MPDRTEKTGKTVVVSLGSNAIPQPSEVGLEVSVVNALTQVAVDSKDMAFDNPSKPVGPFYGQAEVEAYAAGHFKAGTTGPKVAACLRFVRTGNVAVIASPVEAAPMMNGEAGTRIVPNAASERPRNCPPLGARLGLPTETDSQHAPAAVIRGSALPTSLQATAGGTQACSPAQPVAPDAKGQLPKPTRGVPLWNE